MPAVPAMAAAEVVSSERREPRKLRHNPHGALDQLGEAV